MTRGDQHRVADARGAISQIERRTAGLDLAAFAADELVQVWVLYHIAILGEALRTMTPEFQAAHPAINWAGWTGLRNIVVHQYFRVQASRIWEIVTTQLPELRAALEAPTAAALPPDKSSAT